MAIVVLDPRLEELIDINVSVEKIATGYNFTEGPVWHSRERHLTFSDVFAGAMHRWTEQGGARVFRDPSGEANGNTYDRGGNLITCEHKNRRVSRTSPDGAVDIVVDRFEGHRLNSPNDVICAPNGDIVFTDPTYGLRQPDGTIVGQEYPFPGVFRYSASDRSLKLLADDFTAPNGLAIPDDGSRLYVCDTSEQHIRLFDVQEDGSLANGRIFALARHEQYQARPDGMKLDSRGNVYMAGNSAEGVWVFAPDGTLLGFIGIGEELNRQRSGPGGPANLCWGGDDWQTLFVTAVTSVYRLPMKVAGQRVGG